MGPTRMHKFFEHIETEISDTYEIHNASSLDDNSNADMQDSAYKFHLPGKVTKDNSVVMISNERYPDFINGTVRKISHIKSQLSEKSRQVVLSPTHSGIFEGCSYAIWPKHKPISDSKIMKAIKKRLVAQNVYRWLTDAAKDSVKKDFNEEELEAHIRAPLRILADSPIQSEQVKNRATFALNELAEKKWQPITTIQHSDFWLGNILIADKKVRNNDYGFYLIDWGAASTHGGPATDLMQFFVSVNASNARAKQELPKYFAAIGASVNDLEKYLLIGLGVIGMDLGQFAAERFVEKCTQTLSYLDHLMGSNK